MNQDNLKFWQRVGQRTIAKFMANPSLASNPPRLPFGTSDLLKDPISAAKYACLGRYGFARPMQESPIDKICLSRVSDARATLARVMDNVELWLRNGKYGDHRLSKKNVNRAQPPTRDCPADDAPDDQDDLLDNRVCVAAIENASATVTVAMLHGTHGSRKTLDWTAGVYISSSLSVLLDSRVAACCRETCLLCEPVPTWCTNLTFARTS